jgi:hypothetical protein
LPIPKPRRGEKSDEFIGRCMSWMADNEKDRPREQQLAMCYSSLRTARGKGVAPPKEKKELTAAELMEEFVAEVKGAWDVYEASQKEEQMDTAYCVKCKEKVKIKNPKEVKNGIVGVCPKCGTEVHHYRKGE